MNNNKLGFSSGLHQAGENLEEAAIREVEETDKGK